jgi:hypothetical protein
MEGSLCMYEMCGKRFAGCSSLEEHDTSHTGKKANVGSVCGKRFTLLTHLNTHDSFRAEIALHYFTQEKSLSVLLCVVNVSEKHFENSYRSSCRSETTFVQHLW